MYKEYKTESIVTSETRNNLKSGVISSLYTVARMRYTRVTKRLFLTFLSYSMSLTYRLFPSFSKYIVTLYHLFKFPVKKFKKYMKEVEL